MDTYQNLKAFVATAEHGNLSQAARWLHVAPSIVTKRVTQLEAQLKVKLFFRSTRRLQLTENGRNFLERARQITADIDNILQHPAHVPGDFEDIVRVKAPTLITVLHLNRLFSDYLRNYRNARLELVLVDRTVNPIAEGFDAAIGAQPACFAGAVDIPLYPLRRMICASPSYLAKCDSPRHPRDLVRHSCLGALPSGNKWLFKSDSGQMSIDVRPRLICEDGNVLLSAALDGLGIANLPEYAGLAAVRNGSLVRLLPGFSLGEPWLKMHVTERRANAPAVRALVNHFQACFGQSAPWDR